MRQLLILFKHLMLWVQSLVGRLNDRVSHGLFHHVNFRLADQLHVGVGQRDLQLLLILLKQSAHGSRSTDWQILTLLGRRIDQERI